MHSHSHDDDSSTRIGWAFFLNVGFTIIEFIGGVLTNSTAIMADAVHDLGDSLSIGLAWVSQSWGRNLPPIRFHMAINVYRYWARSSTASSLSPAQAGCYINPFLVFSIPKCP